MLRARRGDRENNHPVPVVTTPNTTKARICLSLLLLTHSARGVTTTESLESSCQVQNKDGGSDAAITGMISGKWSGWCGVVEQALLWVAGMGGGVGLPAESLAEFLPQARSRMTHVE